MRAKFVETNTTLLTIAHYHSFYSISHTKRPRKVYGCSSHQDISAFMECFTYNFHQQCNYFLFHYSALNTTCFGHRWPSSGVPLCDTCHTAFSTVQSMRVFDYIVIKMFPPHSTIVRYADVTVRTFKISFKMVKILII
jgi:hypothetical protein